ncbi:MAG TPA: hypothetical protein VFQ61_21455 [Polyangiaceae bacterium]|nr:hypothetical protein [Polyangiaceae bacterium]
MQNHLLLIDPQNDFCDLPASAYSELNAGAGPALPVAGAHQDMLRVAALIEQAGAGLTDITITLDSHQHFDIGHPSFWRHADGTAVSPFTQVTADEVRAGRIVPRRAELVARVLQYLEALESRGRYRHMVWPVHCEIGTWGHNVHASVRRAYNQWEEAYDASVAKVLKGKNPYTEHYSAVQAEVPDPGDSETDVNRELLTSLEAADRVYIAGEASSHCVKSTVEHIVQFLSPTQRKNLALLSDCMSPVSGFEAQARSFLDTMRQAGVRLLGAAEAIAELRRERGARV